MRSTCVVVSLAIVTAAAPAFAAPVSQPFDARAEAAEASELATLGKELGKGLLTGGAFSGLAAAADHFLGDSSSSAAAPAASAASKRQFTEEDVELLKRAVSLGALGKDLGKGLLTGGAFAGLAAAADHFLGDDSSSAAAPAATPASKREIISDDELMRRGIGSIFGKLIGATEEDLPTVIKNALAGGVASGAAIGAVDGALNSTKREVDERSLFSSAAKLAEGGVGDAIKSGLVNGLGSAIGGTVLGELLGGGNSTKRGMSVEKRDQLAQLLTRYLNSREPEPIGSIGKGLIGTGVGLIGSSLAEDAIDEVEKIFKREPEPIGAIGKGLIGTGVGLVGSSLAQDAIDEVEKIFKREIELD